MDFFSSLVYKYTVEEVKQKKPFFLFFSFLEYTYTHTEYVCIIIDQAAATTTLRARQQNIPAGMIEKTKKKKLIRFSFVWDFLFFFVS